LLYGRAWWSKIPVSNFPTNIPKEKMLRIIMAA